MAEFGRAARGGPHAGAPVRPPRRGTSPGPAAAPAAPSPRLERLLWLLVAAVAVAGVAVIAAIVTTGPARNPLSAPGTGTATEPTAPASAPPPVSAPPVEPPGDDADGPPPGWSEVARGFGLAFTRTAPGQDAWLTAMSSWLTPEQADRYRDVPVQDIPTGTLQQVEVDDPGGRPATRGRLTYDTGMVLEVGLSYIETAGGWLVARVTLADPGG